MRENRTHGSEGGEDGVLSYPYRSDTGNVLPHTTFNPFADLKTMLAAKKSS